MMKFSNSVDYGDGFHTSVTDYSILARDVGMIFDFVEDDTTIAVWVLLSQIH